MHLLDTDTLSLVYKNHPEVVAHLRTLPESEVGTTIFTKIEMLRGRIEFLAKAADGAELLRAQELLVRTEEFLGKIVVVRLDAKAGAIFDQLRATKGLKKLGRLDLLIASVALACQATLVSRNMRHFKQIPNLKVVNWVK